MLKAMTTYCNTMQMEINDEKYNLFNSLSEIRIQTKS